MEAISDLNTFAKILTDKGYNGYFHTQGAYAGKLKDSISEYLENCRKGTEGATKSQLLLTGFLQWTGDDNPYVECCMWVKYLNGKFFLHKMEVARKDQFGQLLKQTELTDLSVVTAPKAKEAIAMVSDAPEQRRFTGRSDSISKTDWGMKNLRTTIYNWFDKLDGQWRAMPVKKQHRYTLLLFLGYALLSVAVLLKVCYDVAHSDSTLTIEHIENPINGQNKSSASQQDSMKTILKRKNNERE